MRGLGQLGLDKPLYLQYLNCLSNIFLRFERLDDFERGAVKADILLAKLSMDEVSKLRTLQVFDLRGAFVREMQGIDSLATENLQVHISKIGIFFKIIMNTRPGIELFRV